MTIASIRKKLISFIEGADEKKVKGLYMLVEDEINNSKQFTVTADQLMLLEEEREDYLKGKGKSATWQDVKNILHSQKNK